MWTAGERELIDWLVAPKINWLEASADDRKQLFRTTKLIVDTRFQGDWRKFYLAVFGTDICAGIGYEDNFRAGKIGRKRAHTIAVWLNQNVGHRSDEGDVWSFADDARALLGWEEFLRKHERHDGLSVVRSAELDLSVVGLALSDLRQASVKLKLGEHFFLRLVCDKPGSALGFQETRGAWYPLPLSDAGGTLDLSAGNHILPRTDEGALLPLSEDADPGRCRFIIVVGSVDDLPPSLTKPEIGLPLSSSYLLLLTDALAKIEVVASCSLNVLFEA